MSTNNTMTNRIPNSYEKILSISGEFTKSEIEELVACQSSILEDVLPMWIQILIIMTTVASFLTCIVLVYIIWVLN